MADRLVGGLLSSLARRSGVVLFFFVLDAVEVAEEEDAWSAEVSVEGGWYIVLGLLFRLPIPSCCVSLSSSLSSGETDFERC